MQTHLAAHALDRLNELSEGAAQGCRFTTEGETLLTEYEFAKADRRFNARMLLVEGVLFARDERALGVLSATGMLDSPKEFVRALHQHERPTASLKLAGETPEAIQQWKDEERPHLDAYVVNDRERVAIFTAGDNPQIDDKELKSAKARYVALLSEVTILVDQVHPLESVSAHTEAERQQVERRAKAESQMLGKLYVTNLFNGKSELDAYQLASESLTAARDRHSKRLEATQGNALAVHRRQIDELLASGKNTKVIDPQSAKGFHDRADKVLSDRSVDALAQIRRELAELFDLAGQAKSNSEAALASGAPGSAARSEAYKANEAGREWEEIVQADAHRREEDNDGEEHNHRRSKL